MPAALVAVKGAVFVIDLVAEMVVDVAGLAVEEGDEGPKQVTETCLSGTISCPPPTWVTVPSAPVKLQL